MYAVIETCGKQYKVQEGEIIFLEKLGKEPEEQVVFDKILAVGSELGLKTGSPYVEGAAVEGTVIKNGKEPKVIIFKYKSKKGYRRKQGHRQPYTQVRVDKITG